MTAKQRSTETRLKAVGRKRERGKSGIIMASQKKKGKKRERAVWKEIVKQFSASASSQRS